MSIEEVNFNFIMVLAGELGFGKYIYPVCQKLSNYVISIKWSMFPANVFSRLFT